ncbi:ANTAR domain-containing protein [Streptomyces sp. 891-h]|nr:ANTAR domain-containing protein [Streptomyces sp. 891-h]
MSAATGFVRTSVAAECSQRRAVSPDDAAPAKDEGTADPERELLAARVEELSAEVGQLRQALETRPAIDQARGMVMALAPCDAETAWQVLVRVSQHSNMKLRNVAAALVAGAEGTPVPKPVRKHLAAALHSVRTARG